MPTVPVSRNQLNRINALQKDVQAATEARDLVLGVILDGSEFAGKNLNISHVDEKGIHFEVIGGDPVSDVLGVPARPQLVADNGEGEE